MTIAKMSFVMNVFYNFRDLTNMIKVMRQIYAIIALLVLTVANGQEEQLFENTWHLRTVQSDDLAPLYDVAEMDPPIAPYLKISEDFSFNGEGACNNFNGTYSFYSPNNLTTTDFLATIDDCGIEEQNRFEDDYFYFVSGDFWYDIVQEGDGAVLSLGNPLGGIAVFNSYPLSTKEFYKNEFNFYPNPVNDVLVLSSEHEIGILKIKIFNLEGKLLSTQNLEFQKQVSVDVSNLSRGIYFLNIEDGNDNTAIKKFIKK